MSGRRVHPFISNNFTRIDKKDNLSNRWYWDCNFCDANHAPGCHIEGRDNNLLLHIINAKLCPNASADACREAQAILMEKGKITVLEAVLPIRDDSISTTGDSSESTKFVVLKKQKTGGTLDHYIDHPLTPQQKADADVTFFRLVVSFILSHKCLLDFNRFLVHGNVAFRVAENVFLSEWLNKI